MLDHLPIECLIWIFIRIPFHNITELCFSNKFLYKHLFQNDVFWKKLYLTSYNHTGLRDLKFWKWAYYREITPAIWIFGNNCQGQLGIQSENNKYITQPIYLSNFFPNNITAFNTKDSCKIIDVACGNFHTLILTNLGQVWTFGSNKCGQLGLGQLSEDLKSVPTQILNLPPIEKIFIGPVSSFFIDLNHQVWGCGSNYNKTIHPYSSYHIILKPIPINCNTPIQQIAVSNQCHLALDVNGEVWCGNKKYGPNLNFKNKIVSISAGLDHHLLLDELGNVWIFQNTKNIQTLNGVPKIIQIFAGKNHDILLDLEDSVWISKSNSKDNRNILKITNLPPICNVAIGDEHVLLLTKSGQVYGFGDNSNHQLGINENWIDLPTPIFNLPAGNIFAGKAHSIILPKHKI